MKPSLRDIEWAVCAKFKLAPGALSGPSRTRKISRPRQIAMFIARADAGRSYPAIGRWLHRDHTTVITGCRRVQGLLETNPKVREHVEEIRAILPTGARLASEAAWIERLHAGEVSWPLDRAPRAP